MVPWSGAIPTAEELRQWLGRIEWSELVASSRDKLEALSSSQRLALGAALAVVGLVVMVASWRRARRPRQADLVRRISAAARPAPIGRESPADSSVPTVTPVAPTPASALAYLRAELDGAGEPPWSVPVRSPLVRIGRHVENDVRIAHATVHRYHAILHRSPDAGFVIKNLSGRSGNGVYVNGARVEEAPLRSGDIVELGAARLRFEEPRAA